MLFSYLRYCFPVRSEADDDASDCGDEDDLDSDNEQEEEEEEEEEESYEEEEDTHVFSDKRFGKDHRFTWPKEHGDVRECQRAKRFGNSKAQPELVWSHLDSRAAGTKFLRFFLLFTPFALFEVAAKHIQQKGVAKFGDKWLSKGREFTVGLLLCWIGCFFYMMAAPGYARASYWDSVDDGMFPTHDLTQKSLLTLTDFDRILQFWWIPTYVPDRVFTKAGSSGECGYPDYVPLTDTFNPIRRWMDTFNERWAEVFVPGWLLCIDESMFKWLGRNRCPGWMKVGRKPDSIGHELKTLACAVCLVMCSFELQEGKVLDDAKKYVAEYGAQAALTLRMLEPFKGTQRVLIGDSWFGSVKASILLLSVGMYSVLIVKTGHKLFPKNRLLSMLEGQEPGTHVALSTKLRLDDTEESERVMFAVVQKCPGKMNAKQRKTCKWGADAKGVPMLLVSTCDTSTSRSIAVALGFCTLVTLAMNDGSADPLE